MKFNNPIRVTMYIPAMSVDDLMNFLKILQGCGLNDNAEIEYSWIGTEVSFYIESLDPIECGDCSPYTIRQDLLLGLHYHERGESNA